MDNERLFELQLLSEQAEQVQKYLQNMENQEENINTVLAALDDIKATKGDDEVLIPLTNGIFMRGRLTDERMLLVNVGGEIVVEKTVDDTKQMLEAQKEELEKYKTETMVQFQKILERLSLLQAEYRTSKG